MNRIAEPILTVFTPTYNRAHTLPRTYESLCRQNCKDFIWLIIDDGSTDNTAELVRDWQCCDNGFDIQYIYKENGGLHTAYNTAIAALHTELAMCIDSDDWLTDEAIEKILFKWATDGNKDVAGIEALDCYANGEIIGDLLPNQKTINLIDLYVGKYRIKNGDRKPILRSSLYKMVAPMPTLNGEKNFNPHYMHLQISLKYDFLVMNEPVCIVEYQSNGMSRNIFNQYLDSPNSFAQLRRLCMQFQNVPLLFKVKNAIHFDSSCILAGHIQSIWTESPAPLLTCSVLLPGVALSILTRVIVKRRTREKK